MASRSEYGSTTLRPSLTNTVPKLLHKFEGKTTFLCKLHVRVSSQLQRKRSHLIKITSQSQDNHIIHQHFLSDVYGSRFYFICGTPQYRCYNAIYAWTPGYHLLDRYEAGAPQQNGSTSAHSTATISILCVLFWACRRGVFFFFATDMQSNFTHRPALIFMHLWLSARPYQRLLVHRSSWQSLRNLYFIIRMSRTFVFVSLQSGFF